MNARTALGYTAQRLARCGRFDFVENALRAAGSNDVSAPRDDEEIFQ